jgi:hypothetical protein
MSSAPVRGTDPVNLHSQAVVAPLANPRPSGYGLPCAKCRTYYAANLPACPVCKAAERVSPLPTGEPEGAELAMSVEDAALEQERENFLREFKAQVYSSHMQINAAASFRCENEQNHPGSFEPAAVCQTCYDHLNNRVDILEAALHIDVKEATQVVYEAVWADPSDPSKTYQNAATALLAELRRRAGFDQVLGPNKSLAH